jgi:hypothetical protein
MSKGTLEPFPLWIAAKHRICPTDVFWDLPGGASLVSPYPDNDWCMNRQVPKRMSYISSIRRTLLYQTLASCTLQ